VHKKSIAPLVASLTPQGEKRHEERRFGTITRDLLALADGLLERGVTHVALESTGVYWTPVWNVLEGEFRHCWSTRSISRRCLGRKTDQKDSEWIAPLLQHELLRSSFIPPAPIRQLRDLTRYRVTLVKRASLRIKPNVVCRKLLIYLVELSGIEPLASSLRTRRSPS
jgi:transposase